MATNEKRPGCSEESISVATEIDERKTARWTDDNHNNNVMVAEQHTCGYVQRQTTTNPYQTSKLYVQAHKG